MGQRGAWPKSRDLPFKFWDPPIISSKWLKIQTLNFARGLNVRDTKAKNGPKVVVTKVT